MYKSIQFFWFKNSVVFPYTFFVQGYWHSGLCVNYSWANSPQSIVILIKRKLELPAVRNSSQCITIIQNATAHMHGYHFCGLNGLSNYLRMRQSVLWKSRVHVGVISPLTSIISNACEVRRFRGGWRRECELNEATAAGNWVLSHQYFRNQLQRHYTPICTSPPPQPNHHMMQ